MAIEYENLDDYPLLSAENGTLPPPPPPLPTSEPPPNPAFTKFPPEPAVTDVKEANKKYGKNKKTKSKSAETTTEEEDHNSVLNNRKNNNRKNSKNCLFYIVGLFLALGAGVAIGCGAFFLLQTHMVNSEDAQKYGHPHSTHHQATTKAGKA